MKFQILFFFILHFSLYSQNLSKIEKKYELQSLNIQGFISILSQDKEKLDKVLKKIKDIDTNSLEYYYIKGAKFFSIKDYYQAEKELLKSIQIEKNHSPSYYLLGIIDAQQNQWQSAKDNFSMAVQISRYDPFYRLNLALVYFQLGNLSEAIHQSLKALRTKPNYKEAINLLAKSYYLIGNKKKSFELCEKLERFNYSSYDFYALYAKILFEDIKHYSKVVSLLSKVENLYYKEMVYLAESYLKINHFQKSLLLYRRIIKNRLSTYKDKVNYIKAMVFSDKILEMENYVVKLIKEKPSKEKDILQTVEFFKKEKQTLRMMHQIIPQNPIKKGTK